LKELNIDHNEEFDVYNLYTEDHSYYETGPLGQLIEDYVKQELLLGNYKNVSPLKLTIYPPDDFMPWHCAKCRWIGIKNQLGPEKKMGEFSSWPTCPKCGSIKIGMAHWLVEGEEYPEAEMKAFEEKMKEEGRNAIQ
jgi:hypothetical protein